MKIFSVSTILSVLCIAYISHTVWTMYHIYNVPSCVPKSSSFNPCISSWLFMQAPDGTYNYQKVSIVIYGSSSATNSGAMKRTLLYQNASLDLFLPEKIDLNVTLPNRTFKIGKYFLHAFLHRPNTDPLVTAPLALVSAQLTELSIPQLEAFNLIGKDKNDTASKNASDVPVPHWRSRIVLSVMTDDVSFDQQQMPGELIRFIQNRVEKKTSSYFPIIVADHMNFRIKDLQKLEESKPEMPLTIVYQPMSIGKLRLWTNLEASFKMMKGYGFGQKEIDELKGIFVDTNVYFLLMTFVVSALHILFDTLAFKNDISYWRNRKTMVGLSSKAVVWRCISSIIILLYLIDSDTSLLVSVPAAISALIELWKLKKAFKISFHFSSPFIQFGESSTQEKETAEFDAIAMGYLNYLLLPLLFGLACYSLFYTAHRSFYSWVIQSLVNGVYAFGFLFMLPQLFVNYKLKSVAHLPWKAFMYKAFNTFIDDIFAFIITMPTAHRVACFRDDIVFVFYLYQRWLYPVDKSRINEYGQSFVEASQPQADSSKEDSSTGDSAEGDSSEGDSSKGYSYKGDSYKGDSYKGDSSKGYSSNIDSSKGDSVKCYSSYIDSSDVKSKMD
ncbi:lipid scramblase CLPTM1L-like [Watersipora subatra]|uniref:lipid scramblase CLPTM1L-like n=1 Tax=Watersipora subatra TaxID=2589382 RepID=UPI00355BC579